MAQSSLQTECPKCHTRFRVTDEQLGLAKGKVRCGHCMAVFNAIEHKIASATSGTQKAPSVTGSKTPPERESSEESASGFVSDTSGDDFIFADNPEEDAQEGRYAGTKLTFSDDELSDSFRSFDDRNPSSLDETSDDDPTGDVDESWAEAILREDDAPADPAKPGPETATEVPSESKPQPEPLAEEAEPEKDDSPTDPPQELQQEDPSGFFVDEQADPALESFANEHEPDPDRGHQAKKEPFEAGAPFGDLRHEPISMGGGNKSWLRTLTWSVIVLGLIGVLVAQVTWFQFDRLSAIPELRPFYEKGCELAGCELKPLINVEAIQSRKLVVRTDPENRNQLVVDAVIINRAVFQQPFPAIALTFSNLNGDVVAQSIFTPSDYLAGEAEELDIMPVETPVRIAITIRDPGRDAVNYNIIFRPYTP
ncbi:DUF3426 domain-containing protein [Marinobacter xiaoshiensis]|uniref:DUF3426 domain-containing protein n=1 Tax=Marinobacter xiaoshiensis TaxID=3073652 RepID=A0ABU2HJ81_9GAMM|nr:DUF3426 domain-containing protein [Marinobacter sp. F60267]MDS1311122.1 DUF3426 domain-containing protein [Marinobacter sp. F60267]